MDDLFDELEHHNVRFDHLFWAPGVAACGTPPDVFERFVEAVLEDTTQNVEAAIPRLKGVAAECRNDEMSERDAAEEISCVLAYLKVSGFIALVATPVTSNHRSGGYSFSWGHYRTDWIYAETLQDLVKAACAWAADELAKDKTRAA